jgi:hypothetical protein
LRLKSFIGEERRRNPRVRCGAVINLVIQTGPQRGASFVSLLHDISDGGACVILDGGVFARGTAVFLDFLDEVRMPAWVCHCTSEAGFCRLGLSFGPINEGSPESCWEEQRCQLSPVNVT